MIARVDLECPMSNNCYKGYKVLKEVSKIFYIIKNYNFLNRLLRDLLIIGVNFWLKNSIFVKKFLFLNS